MEKQLTCICCANLLNSRLNVPVVVKCSSCSTTVSVDDANQITLIENKWNQIPEISVLKLSSKGKYLDKKFELIGRIRNITSTTIENDWLMYFEDGSYLWLTESNFTYFVSEIQPLPVSLLNLKDYKVGNSITIQGISYTINELSKRLEMKVEGEIPLDSFVDEPYFKYELTAAFETNWVTICIYDKNAIEVTKCRKVELNTLQLTDITEFKDWM